MPLFDDINIYGWRPGIGDATIAGWLTVLCYCAAAFLCRRRCVRVRAIDVRTTFRPGVFLWKSLAVVFIALSVNKMFDLASAFTAIGRKLAADEGWYDERRSVLVWVVLAIGLAAVAAGAMAFRLRRRASRRAKVAIAGMAFLMAFIAARASSYHDFEAILGLRVAGLKVNWVAECLGIAVVALAAAWNGRLLKQSV